MLLALTACALAGAARAQDEPAMGLPDRPVLAAYGLSRAVEVAPFKEAGFDLALVELPLTYGDAEGEWESLGALLEACDREGVAVMLGMRAVAPPPDGPVAVVPSDGGYRNSVGTRIYHLIQAVEPHPCVVAWLSPSRLSEAVAPRREDLRDYLTARYADVEALQRVWGPQCADFARATRDMAAESAGRSDLGLSMSLLDVATCDALVHRTAVSMFVDSYLRFDRAQRPVVAGEETAFWALANLPAGLAGAVTGIDPAEAPIDPATGNAIAVDAARAAGTRDAFFGIDVTADTGADDLRRRIQAGLVHGARGVVLSDWRTAASDPELAEALAEARATLERFEGYLPANTVALVYQPIHMGARNSAGRPLYGLVDARGWTSEPMAALELYGRGHRFGGIDVVPAQSVGPGALARYAVVLAPQLYDVDPALGEELWAYVRNGGLLYCDLGLASRQTGTFRSFPEAYIALTGILQIRSIFPMEADAEVAGPTPVAPSMPAGARTTGLAFRGAVGDVRITAGARPALVIRARRDETRANVLYYAGVFTNSFGEGAVVFASTQCLGTWTPHEPLGDRFWGDLFSRGARIENEGAPGLLPGDTEVRDAPDRVVVAHYGERPTDLYVRTLAEPGVLVTGAVVEAGLLGGRVPSPTILRGSLGPGESLVARYAPLRVTGPRVLAWVAEYGPDGARLLLAPFDAECAFTDSEPMFEGGSPTPYYLELSSGAMPVEPGDEFRVAIHEAGSSRDETLAVVADERGVASIAIEERGPIEVRVRRVEGGVP